MLFLLVWMGTNQRRKLKREVDSKLRSAVFRAADGGVLFDGKSAVLLLKDYTYLGAGDTEPSVSAKFLCKMPGAAVYWVIVDSASEIAPANVAISELNQAEVDDVLATYPYLKHLNILRKRDA